MSGKGLFSSLVQPTSALRQMGIAKSATHRVTSPQQRVVHGEGTVCPQLLASHTGHELSCGEKAVMFLGCEMTKCWGLRRKKGQGITEKHRVAAATGGCTELCTGSVPAQTPPSWILQDPAMFIGHVDTWTRTLSWRCGSSGIWVEAARVGEQTHIWVLSPSPAGICS